MCYDVYIISLFIIHQLPSAYLKVILSKVSINQVYPVYASKEKKQIINADQIKDQSCTTTCWVGILRQKRSSLF